MLESANQIVSKKDLKVRVEHAIVKTCIRFSSDPY